MNRRAGFTLVELLVTFAIITLILAGVLRAFDSASKAGGTGRARTGAIEAAETVAETLVTELRQSSPDTASPTNRRYWILPNGVRFQRVVGSDMSPTNSGAMLWSPEIEYTLDAATGEVVRSENGGATRRIARGITEFDVEVTPSGALVITVAATRRAPDGADIEVRRTRRVLPRNTTS